MRIVCGKLRWCAKGDYPQGPRGNVGTRPKQPPSTLKQARGQSRRCLLRFPLTFLPTYLLFSRRFLRLDFLFQRRRQICSSHVLPLSFHGYAFYSFDVFSLFLSRLSSFPSTITPLERRSLGDPSICSVWQSTTTAHCHHTISTPRLVYIAAV